MKHDEREGKRVTTTSSSIIKDDHRHRNYSETSTGNSDANNTQTFAAAWSSSTFNLFYVRENITN